MYQGGFFVVIEIESSTPISVDSVDLTFPFSQMKLCFFSLTAQAIGLNTAVFRSQGGYIQTCRLKERGEASSAFRG